MRSELLFLRLYSISITTIALALFYLIMASLMSRREGTTKLTESLARYWLHISPRYTLSLKGH